MATQPSDDERPASPPETLEPEPSEHPEIAHVLFMDVVAFTTLPMEEQREVLRQLQQIVSRTPKFRLAERDKRLIRLPTGDGMALAFFGDPVSAVECALEISAELASVPNLKLRMGVNSGLVFRHLDINANLNVQGGGINEAQRITDAGDAGHILVSKGTAELLMHLQRWRPHLHDLGQHAVKHGQQLHFYNLYTGELGNPAPPSKFVAERTRRTRTRTARMVVAVVALAAFAAGGFVLYRQQSQIERKQHVAVMGFRNNTSNKDVDWVAGDLADGLRTQLGDTDKLRVTSAQECATLWKNLGLSRLESFSKSTLSQLKQSGADFVVVGSYRDLGKSGGNKIHVSVELQDAGEGETVLAINEEGTEAELDSLVARAAARLRIKLGLGEISPRKNRQIEMAQAPPGIREVYYLGLRKLQEDYKPEEARSYLERAVKLEPAFPLGHYALAEAWSELGYDLNATDEAKQAVDLSKGLSFEDQQSIKGRYYSMATKWKDATEAYEQLYHFDPGNLEYGLQLVKAQWSAGQGNDALATLDNLRKLPKPEGDDPRIDLTEAEILKAHGDMAGALKSAELAASKAKNSGARLLRARALHWTCATLRTMGEPDKAKSACEESRTISRDLDDKLGIARAATGLGNIQYDRSDLEGAKRLYGEALDNVKIIGAKKDISGAVHNLGMVFEDQGNLEEAKKRYQEALSIQQEIGDRAESAKTLTDLGDLLRKLGDLEQAQHTLEEASDAALLTGSQRTEANALTSLAGVLLDRGKLNEARQRYERAIPLQRQHGTKINLGYALDGLGDVLVSSGDLPAAEQRYQEAISVQDGTDAAFSRTGLAAILIEKGQASQAEASLRPAIQEFRSKKDADDELLASTVLIRALLEQKKFPEAQQELAPLNQLAAATSQRSLRYGALIVSGRLRCALDRSAVAEALSSLQKVAQEAKKAGMPGPELEARLAIGEIESAHGHVARGRSDLSAVQKEATADGFIAIATRAGNALNGKGSPA
jgi:tetratricopeptide (TPR) repeat protein/class 3 adenylate cyclase/TolB-like protein